MLNLLRGILVGLGIASPVGPIGLLCIRRTLEAGWLTGFASGLGAATADFLYGCVAVSGIATITAALVDSAPYVHAIGGLLLLWIGWQALHSTPQEAAPAVPVSKTGAFATTLGLTILNPATILSFLAVIGGLGARGLQGGFQVVVGIFLGSCLWWVALCSGVAIVRHRLSDGLTKRIGIASGVGFIGFGIWILATIRR